MAVYQFSALSDGTSISFNPSVDRLSFDQTSVAAGDLNLVQEGPDLHVIVKSGTVAGKDIFLSGTALEQIAATNFTFVDGSAARVGDNAVGTAGDAAANALVGTAGRDLLMGLGGNDNLNGGSGNDWLEGNAGNDTLTGSGGQDTFALRESGAANADSLADFASNWDRIELDLNAFPEIGATGRFATNDARFFAGTAAHDADDRIIYNSATGQIFYDADGNGAGTAQLIATLPAGRGVVAGDFNVFGTPPPAGNTINGTAGNDTLTGTSGPDTINGLGGDDSIDGAFGADSLNGGTGNDYLFGGSDVDRTGEGADILVGGDGNDTLDGWSISNRTSPDPNVETLDGGLGNDVFNVDNEADVLRDAGGTDLVQARTGDWTLAAGFENLILFDQEDGTNEGIGNELDNVMESRAWEAELQGMGGNDLLTVYDVGGRTQILRGGDGNDTLIGSSSTTRTTLDGGAGDDSMVGGSATMTGGDGNDTLVGISGLDLNDMTGGAGSDRFVFTSADNFTFLRDFASGSDRLVLDGSGFDGIGASGDLSASDERFFAAAGATAAHDATDRIILNTSTGDLYYDADGNGSATAQRIAAVTGTLAATDITVINGVAGQAINGTAGNDSLTGGAGNDTINGLAGNDTIDGGDGADTLDGGTGNDSLSGGEGLDLLLGGDGNDTMEGRQSKFNDFGADTLSGGLGDDTYIVRGDIAFGTDVILADPGGIDTVVAVATSWTLGAGLENLELRDTSSGSAFRGIGNELDNKVSAVGNEGTEQWGMAGNDTLIGSGFGASDLHGGEGDDRVFGSAHADHLSGDAGNDWLDGGGVDDDLTGGAGNDSFAFSWTEGFADKITDFASGVDKVVFDGTYFTEIGASGNFVAGDARFFAGAAAHDADDRVIWDGSSLWYDPDGTGATAQVRVADLQAAATVAATDIAVVNGTAPGGQTINGTAGNDRLEGGDGNDTINGFAGNDSIDGSSGADIMVGGAGDDLYLVGDPGDVVIEAENEGIDEVGASVAEYTLPDWVNNLWLTVDGAIGTGNAIDNVMASGTGGATLNGLAGNDTLTGSQAIDVLSGGDGNDSINAFFGDDTLDGGSGVDTMNGGDGRDTYYVTAGDVLSDSGGNDSVIAGISWSLASAFENLALTGSTNLDASGNFFANAITGNSGNNILKGRDGHDTLTGAGGNDFFDFVTAPSAANSDVITDFTSGADRLRLDDGVHAGIGATGNFAAGDGRFFAGAGATSGHDANDRVVYDTSTGALYYDADGSGAGAAQLVATLQGHPALAATDISVI